MKSQITLKRILHHSAWRYGIFFSYDPELTKLVRSVPGVRYSGTFRCWYVNCDDMNLRVIQDTFRDHAEIEFGPDSSDQSESADMVEAEAASSGGQPGEGQGRGVTGTGGRYGAVEFTLDESNDKLIIKFKGRYDQSWISELRSYGRVWYDKFRREWVLDWSRMAVDSLSDYFSGWGAEVIVKRSEVPRVIRGQRKARGEEIRSRELDEKTREGIINVRHHMESARYSDNTIGAYISLLEIFFRYFHPRGPSELTAEDVSGFFYDYVYLNRYSVSYQNQIISAIRVYYGLNGPGVMDISLIGRPRKGRSLPKVFSKEEIKQILNSTRNLKHKVLLWMIYSCGLRRSEVINIKLRDLDRVRSLLNIIESKGKVDRIVPVSAKVWEKLDEYIESYHPSYWLFEGQAGGRYSSESVYRVFRQALRRAGIRKEVGVHSLRHSYATHLHESGLDIRYIQELLGHKSSRTTEIYTHVSRRNLVSIRSPIEDIELK